MPLPWVQIVQWVPSILEVSRQLLQETRKRPPVTPLTGTESSAELVARIASLEANEQRLVELIHQMAEHTGQMTQVMAALQKQLRWLVTGQAVIVAAVIIAALAAR